MYRREKLSVRTQVSASTGKVRCYVLNYACSVFSSDQLISETSIL